MPFSRDRAYAALASLNPASVFLQSYQSRSLPEGLEIYFGPPEELFLAPETQERYTGNHLVPLLDDGNFGLVTFLDPDTRELVQIDVESPDESRTIFQHWQQYLADLLLQIGESVEDDEDLRRIADLIGFAHTDELFAYFARTDELSPDEWSEAREQFLSSIAG
jgi:hypothetical protein